MAAPTGLYGHIRANHGRSLMLFAMFAFAFQLLGAVSLFLPLLIFDPAHTPVYENAAYVQRYVPLLFALSLILYAAQMWWFVGAVRRDTRFDYVDSSEEPRFCRILEPLAIAAGITTPYAGVIESPSMNAFACGVRDKHMVVVATRGLIDGLDDDELAAVLANGVIHIRNRDTRLLAAATIFMRNMTVLQKKKGLQLSEPIQVLPLVMFPVFLPVSLLICFFGQVAFRLAYASRALIGMSREFIADAEAVRLTHKPAALISALHRIEARRGELGDQHDSMLIVGVTQGPLATHPTIEERAGALARTTGSLVFDAAPRLDTRLIPARRAAGFGRRPDPALERIAALAEAPKRRGLWGAFRSVRDPERNLMGLNRRAVAIIGASLVGIGALYQPSLAQPAAAAAKIFDPGMLRQFGGMGRTVARCVIAFDATEEEVERCEKDAAQGGRFFEHIPLFAPEDGKPREYLTHREREQRRAAEEVARGCFSGRWGGMARPSYGGTTMETLRAFAGRDVSVLDLAPGPERDKALADYAGARVILIENSLAFHGETGFHEFNRGLGTAGHEAVLQLLAQRMKDSAFRRSQGYNDSVDIDLLVSRSTELRPCWAEDGAALQS